MATIAASVNGHLEQIAARRWYFLTALQPITCQKHKRTCVDIQHASPAQQLQQNTATVMPRFTSPYAHTAILSLQTSACRLAVKILLCQFCGLISDSGTSIQQGIASDVLVSIAVCMCRLLLHLNLMCGSASCVVTCLDLQSDTCISIVTIILMGQA